MGSRSSVKKMLQILKLYIIYEKIYLKIVNNKKVSRFLCLIKVGMDFKGLRNSCFLTQRHIKKKLHY